MKDYYESWLTTDKVIATIINRLLNFGPPYIVEQIMKAVAV